jgi:hypothetical protein
MELTLVDASNPIHECMKRARSTVEPELDEESPETNTPIPSVMVTGIADPRDLDHNMFHNGHERTLVTIIRKKKNICYEAKKAKHKTEMNVSQI